MLVDEYVLSLVEADLQRPEIQVVTGELAAVAIEPEEVAA